MIPRERLRRRIQRALRRAPAVLLARTYEASRAWRDSFIATFLERDLVGFGL